MRCRYCSKDAVTRIPYARLNLCAEHFMEYLESRVSDTMRRYSMVGVGDRVLLASSGGKDSVTLTYVMNSLSSSLGFRYAVLHIDLGIGEYSRVSRDIAVRVCRELGVDYVVVELGRDLGLTLPELRVRLRARRTCSLCGIVKRYVMNAAAIELGVNAVATAHHADDILTYIFKNFILQDYTSLSKLGPISKGIEGLTVTRVRPLYEVYETETTLYAYLKGLRTQGVECPFKNVGSIEVGVRSFLNDLESKAPGTKIAMLRKFAKYVGQLQVRRTESISRCGKCGLISQEEVCSFCKLTERASGQAAGLFLRESIRNLLKPRSLNPSP